MVKWVLARKLRGGHTGIQRPVTGLVTVLLAASLAGCATTPTQQGAVAGGLLGAVAGGVIGHQSGARDQGAVIGAGAGALVGALIGDQVDEYRDRRAAAPVVIPRTTAIGAQPVVTGRYETRLVRAPSGELYEERVWLPYR